VGGSGYREAQGDSGKACQPELAHRGRLHSGLRAVRGNGSIGWEGLVGR